MKSPMRRFPVLICGLLWCLASPVGATGVHVSLGSVPETVNPGDVFMLTVNVFQADDTFNAFDAYLQFDPTRLEFVPATPLDDQVGAVMGAECGNFFHLFTAHPDYVEVHLSLLCGNTFVTGPGEIYKLKFRALAPTGPTMITWLAGTEFYRSGFFVRPAELVPLTLAIGNVDAVGPRAGSAPGFELFTPLPNPCRGTGLLNLEFSLPAAERVAFELFDSQGRRVAARSAADFGAGRHVFPWAGLRLAPGRYLLRMSSATGGFAERSWIVLR